MKTTFSKKELREKAAKVFQENTGSVIYATSDGQMFFNKNRAELHANSSKEKLAVYDFARADMEEETQEEDFEKLASIAVLKKQLPEMNDFSELKEMLSIELNGEKRKTAVTIIDARIKELAAIAPEPTSDPETNATTSNEEDQEETTKTEE